jgi:shikimate dehydrogenase
MEEVPFLNGKTRLYGIVGDPIEQVRSPEMVTCEMHKRQLNAVLLPIHVPSAEFEAAMPHILTIQNLDGLIFTIPFKGRAMALTQHIGPQAQAVGAINALARRKDGSWAGEIFDGLGCVEGFRRRGLGLKGQRVMLIGLGGAGSAICAAIAAEQPLSMRIFDLDTARCDRMAGTIKKISPETAVVIGAPSVEDVDVLFNASPVGMLTDPRLPIHATHFDKDLIVFDAIVKPEQTPLLALAESCGCRVVRGREMMRGQISKIVDYFIEQTSV